MPLNRYFIAAGIGANLADYAGERGVDIDPICASLGIDPGILQELTGRIRLEQFCNLLDICATRLHDDAFGLKYAQAYVFGSTGPFGYGLLVAPTVRDFFNFHEAYTPVTSAADYCQLAEDGDFFTYKWSLSPLIAKRDQFADVLEGLLVRLLERIVGPVSDMLKVDLERPAPRDEEPFRQYLSQDIHFGQAANVLRAPGHLLDIANAHADERLFRLMDLQCQTLQTGNEGEDELLAQLKEFIVTRLQEDSVTLADAARFFGVTERTLQRRLAERGTTLNDLRDTVRCELAARLLADTAMSASDIAYRLGYSAPSAFTRSFLRWYGRTPIDFRKKVEAR